MRGFAPGIAHGIALGIDRVSAALDRIALWGAILGVTAMVGAAGWQVLARYVLDAPPIWTEELARRAMVWAGMLGASCAFRAKADPTLFPGAQARGGGLGVALRLVRASGVLIFAGTVLWFSLFGPGMNMARGFVGRSLSRSGEMIDISMAWFTSAVPVAFAIILVHLAADLATAFAAQGGTAPAVHDPRDEPA